ncbi:MAG: ethylbenzene dehydrogenase-related protein [Bacillota bacterium]
MQVIQRLRGLTRRQKLVGGVLIALLGLSVALAVAQVGMRRPVAGNTVLIRTVKELPGGPWAAGWRKVSGIVMPLSVVSTPNPLSGNVQVKAVSDGQQVAIRLEWADDSQELNTLRPQEFADAAAIQLTGGVTNACMGQLDAPVQIWHWRADGHPGARSMATAYPNMWVDGFHDDSGQAAAVLGDQLYSRAALAVGNRRALPDREGKAEQLVAGGFSTLTTDDHHPTAVAAEWQEGRWAVVFTRPLQGEGSDYSFTAEEPLQAAFAVWDGKLQQRDGMKYITDWAVFQLKR